MYQQRFDGRPVVYWYVEARSARLAPRERAWLAAQRAAWVSVWEVLDVDAGATLTLRDLLTGEERAGPARAASPPRRFGPARSGRRWRKHGVMPSSDRSHSRPAGASGFGS